MTAPAKQLAGKKPASKPLAVKAAPRALAKATTKSAARNGTPVLEKSKARLAAVPAAKSSAAKAPAKAAPPKAPAVRTPAPKPVAAKAPLTKAKLAAAAPAVTAAAVARPVANHKPPVLLKFTQKPEPDKAGSGKFSNHANHSSNASKSTGYIPRSSPPPQQQIARVMSDGKPKKNQAGLSSKELEMFRDLLLEKRRELVGDMSSMEREALRSATGTNLSNLPMHMADQGTDNYEQEFTLGLVEKDRQLLREINRALAKILDGTYGICEGTGKPITKARLEVQPWAKYSIEYARQLESNILRR